MLRPRFFLQPALFRRAAAVTMSSSSAQSRPRPAELSDKPKSPFFPDIQELGAKFQTEQWTACDAADAMVKHGDVSGGYIPGLVQQSINSAGPVATGPAYTVLYAPLDDPRPSVKGGYIDDAPQGSVVVIATDKSVQLPDAPFTRVSNALYGGLMSTRANYLHCGGSVVLGKIRDLEEHRDLGYSVHSYGLGTTAPGTAVKVVAVNEPLEVICHSQSVASAGETETRIIRSGDLVVADVNGVVILPSKEAQEIATYVAPRVKADKLVASDIKEGIRAGEAQKERRRNI